MNRINKNDSRKSERDLLFFREPKLFLKFQPLCSEVHKETFLKFYGEAKIRPESGYHAQFSGPFTFALALRGGGGLGVYLDDFTDAAVADPVNLDLAARGANPGSAPTGPRPGRGRALDRPLRAGDWPPPARGHRRRYGHHPAALSEVVRVEPLVTPQHDPMGQRAVRRERHHKRVTTPYQPVELRARLR